MKGNADGGVIQQSFWTRVTRTFENTTDQSFSVWLVIALLGAGTQAILFWTMAVSRGHSDGNFGVLNSALGIVGLMATPVVGIRQAFHLFFAQARDSRLDLLRASSMVVTETFAWVWGACCFILVLLPLPLPTLPVFSWQLLTLFNTLLAIGSVVSGSLCADSGQRSSWAKLLLAAAVTRLSLGGAATAYQPWIDAALGAFIIAGFITLTPALRPREIDAAARFRACLTVLDREFLLFAAATVSVLLGIYLFSNGDRIAVLQWAGADTAHGAVMNFSQAPDCDSYQATGLLARSLLWGTQPLLWIWYAERTRLVKTSAASLTFFWIYIASLVAGAITLAMLTRAGAPLGRLVPAFIQFGSTFAFIMVPLGLLQAFGIFALASRRYPECFVFGGCSAVYALVLAWFGRRPDIMLPYMFGLSLISITVILLVGVVRWGRKQP